MSKWSGWALAALSAVFPELVLLVKPVNYLLDLTFEMMVKTQLWYPQ